MIQTGFDQQKYLELQTKEILRRVKKFERLYLEVGGKLVDDLHAERVLLGFDPSSKLKVLASLKDRLEVIVCVSAIDLEQNKIRSDNHLSYADESIRLINVLQQKGLLVQNVVITLFDEQKRVPAFKTRLEKSGLKVFLHSRTPGYPTDIDLIVSPDGYGENDFIPTKRDIVVVTAPGPASGKMATCLSQIYHESVQGRTVGYAKYETFPVWDLPLKHPVNIAYEAATLDLNDANMIDPFHLAAYDKIAVNYNRDVDNFPVLKRIFDRIYGREVYKSPTDMGVNVISQAITNDEVIRQAAREEVIRRFFKTALDNQLGNIDDVALERARLLVEEVEATPLDREVAYQAIKKLSLLNKENLDYDNQATAIQLPDGRIITGKKAPLLSSIAAAMLNTLKVLAGIDDKVLILSPEALGPIKQLKKEKFGLENSELSLEEVLVALAVSVLNDETAKLALDQIDKLRSAQLHSTCLLSDRDQLICRHLGIDVTVGMIES